jgi:hypothetical protein
VQACTKVLHDLGCKEEYEDQVSSFLHCCLRLLNDPEVASKLTQMLATCMREQGVEETISSSTSRKRCMSGQQAKVHWLRI